VWFSVDPGANTAVAVWDSSELIGVQVLPQRTGTHSRRMERLAAWFDRLLAKHEPASVAVERPRYMERRHVTAASGDLVKLVEAYAILWGVTVARCGPRVWRAVEVNEWKGQLTKAMTATRVRATLRNRWAFRTDHEWDAVGIGLYVTGRF